MSSGAGVLLVQGRNLAEVNPALGSKKHARDTRREER